MCSSSVRVLWSVAPASPLYWSGRLLPIGPSLWNSRGGPVRKRARSPSPNPSNRQTALSPTHAVLLQSLAHFVERNRLDRSTVPRNRSRLKDRIVDRFLGALDGCLEQRRHLFVRQLLRSKPPCVRGATDFLVRR